MNDDRNAASGSWSRMRRSRRESARRSPTAPCASAAHATRAATRGRSTGRPSAARASSRRAGPSPPTDRGRGAGRVRGPRARVRSRDDAEAARARPPRRCRGRTTRCPARRARARPRHPRTRSRASSTIDSGVRDRCLPRNDGIAQNAHARSQPSATLRYAHGADDAARGSSRRSRTPVGCGAGARAADLGTHELADRARPVEADHGIDLGERGSQLVAVALGHAAGDHDPGARPAGRRRGPGRCRSTRAEHPR